MAGAVQNQDDMITGINVVPLVDIVLVLLIIFMVTANFIAKPAIDMELPKADSGEAKERNQFSLLLGRDGSTAIGERRVDEADIDAEFRLIIEEFKAEKRSNIETEGRSVTDNMLDVLASNELTMVIQADALVPHGRVIKFIDRARLAGITKYAFNVDPAAIAAGAETSEPARKKANEEG